MIEKKLKNCKIPGKWIILLNNTKAIFFLKLCLFFPPTWRFHHKHTPVQLPKFQQNISSKCLPKPNSYREVEKVEQQEKADETSSVSYWTSTLNEASSPMDSCYKKHTLSFVSLLPESCAKFVELFNCLCSRSQSYLLLHYSTFCGLPNLLYIHSIYMQSGQ